MENMNLLMDCSKLHRYHYVQRKLTPLSLGTFSSIKYNCKDWMNQNI